MSHVREEQLRLFDDRRTDLLDGLNERQREVVMHSGNPLRVIAGPGTGKTETLARRVAYLISEGGVRTSEILVLTFSKRAAEEMEHRISRLIGRSYDEMWVSTFHAFCIRILRENYQLVGLPHSFKVLTGFKEWAILREIFQGSRLRSYFNSVKDKGGFINEVSSFIKLMKQNLISPEEFSSIASGGDFPEPFEDIAYVYRKYSEMTAQQNCLDFGDLISRAIDFFRDPHSRNAADRYREKFKHIVVDEFQDTDPAQFRLLTLLGHGKRDVCVVGDDKQSIYRFRGATPENVRKFLEAFPDAVTVELDLNYRSNSQILDLAGRFYSFRLSEGESWTPLRPRCRPAESLVTVALEQTSADEAFYVAREIKSLVSGRARRTDHSGDGDPCYTYGDFAILMRSVVGNAEPFKQALDFYGIPYRVTGSVDFSLSPLVGYLISILKLLAFPDSDREGLNVIDSPYFGASRADVKRICDDASAGSRTILEELLCLSEGEGGPLQDESSVSAVRRFAEAYKVLRSSVEEGAPLSVIVYRAMSELVLKPLFDRAEDDGEGIGNELSNLKKFLDFSVEYEEVAGKVGLGRDFADFVGYLDDAMGFYADECAGELEDSDSVKIMSVHQSKGLEFRVVFMVGLNEGSFPISPREEKLFFKKELLRFKDNFESRYPGRTFYLPWAVDTSAHISEEKRLFFVGVTRAKERLYLTAFLEGPAGEPLSPSMFLEWILGGRELSPESFSEVLLDGVPMNFSDRTYSKRLGSLSSGVPSDIDEVLSREELEAFLRSIAVDMGLRDKLVGEIEPLRRELSSLDVDYILKDVPYPPEPPRKFSLGRGYPFSASKVRDYLRCPMYFYNRWLLGLSPVRSPEIITGNILHAVMRRLHDPESTVGFSRDEVLAVFEEVWREFEGEYPSELERSIGRAFLERALESYISDGDGSHLRKAHAVERDFDFRLDGFRIRGRIDRIDKLPGGYEVIDYKKSGEGKEGALLNSFMVPGRERDLQLPIYYLACSEALGIKCVRLSYYFLSHKSSRSFAKISIDVTREPELTKGGVPTKRPTKFQLGKVPEVRRRIVEILGEMAAPKYGYEMKEACTRGRKRCEYFEICNLEAGRTQG